MLDRDATENERDLVLTVAVIGLVFLTAVVIWQRVQLENMHDNVMALWDVIRQGHY